MGAWTRRVLLVGDHPPPAGGIATHVKQLHAALSRRGFECRVLDIGAGGEPSPGVLRGKPMPVFVRELWRHGREGWLFHVHTSGNNPKAWAVVSSAAAVASACRTPMIVTVHSGRLPELLQTEVALRQWARLACLGPARVIAVSEAVAEALRRAGVAPQKLEVCPAFCPTELEVGEPPSALKVIRETRRPLLLMAHHPSPIYGRGLAFDALALGLRRYPRLGLALFGPGSSLAEVKADAIRRGVEAHVDDLGELQGPQALAAMRQADVFVRPTTADGDSVSVREALALGVPCVASDVALRPAGTFVFRRDDPQDLLRALEAALTTERTPHPQPDAAAYLARVYQALSSSPDLAASAAP